MDDYAQEVQAFYGWLEANELSPSAISLWHALLSIKHKAEWAERFTAAVSTLETKTGTGEKTIFRARKELQEKGLLVWTSRGGGKSAEYSLIPFVQRYQTNGQTNGKILPSNDTGNAGEDKPQDKQEDERGEKFTPPITEGTSEGTSEGKNFTVECPPLIKKEKEKIYAHARVDFSTIMETWKEVFGAEMKPSHIERVVDHLENDGMEEVLIVEALERTRDADEATMKYTWATLRDWMKNGLKTMRDLIEYERQHDEKRSQFQQQKPKLHVVRNEEPKERPVVDREPIDLLGMEG